MDDSIVLSEIECAIEFFLDDDEISPTTVKRFLSKQIRSIKVDHPHIDPRWIDKETARIWKELAGVSLAEAVTAR